MASFTITYPLARKAQVLKGIRQTLGEDAEGLTDAEAAQKCILRYLLSLTRPIARREAVSDVLTAAEAVATEKEAAYRVAYKARVDAEVAADAKLDSDFGG